MGFTSIFAYCTNKLGLSQDEAFHRIEAARVARRFPLVLEYLEKGAVTLTTVRLLGAHLTSDNHKARLDAASHQKKPDVAFLIARICPKPDVPSAIRTLPATRGDRSALVTELPLVADALPAPGRQRNEHAPPVNDTLSVTLVTAPVPAVSHSAQQIASRRPIIAPLSEASYRLQVTISKKSHDTLREIRRT